MRTHNRSHTSISSIGSSTTTPIRVEELKSKINQLELVLRQDKTDRETAYDRLYRIANLENELERERTEKLELRQKLEAMLLERDKPSPLINRLNVTTYAAIGTNNRDSTHSATSSSIGANKRDSTHSTTSSLRSDGLSSCTTATTDESGAATVVGSPMSCSMEDWRRLAVVRDTDKLEIKVRMLEAELEKHTAVSKRELEYQQALTELKLSKQSLLTQNDSFKQELKSISEGLKNQKTRAQSLERKLSNKASKLEATQSKLKEALSTIESLTKDVEMQKKTATTKAKEADDLRTRISVLETELSEAQLEQASANRQVSNLQKELAHSHEYALQSEQHAQKERWAASHQIGVLERTQRRNERKIIGLEATLQDLKISLEEKAMENDELNRSIQRVMEQAHESIEDVKRRSLGSAYTASSYTASPRLSLSSWRAGVSELGSVNELATEEAAAM